jgi:hypothetical protein
MRHRCIPLAITAIVAFSSAVLCGRQAVRVPGTGVTLVPPEGFTVAQRFPGFEHPGLQASIMVSELPSPAAEMKAGLTTEALAGQGLTVVDSSTVRIDGADALLLELAQQSGGIDFQKWMLVAGDRHATILIVGSFPRSAPDNLSVRIRESLMSATRVAQRAPDAFEGLLFRVTPSVKLKLARRMSNMLVLTESGVVPAQDGEAVFIVGSAVADSAIADLRAFSEGRAAQTATLTKLRNVSGRSVEIGGLAAYELTADARDAQTGDAIRLYQVVVPDAGSYFIIQGLSRSKGSAAMLEEFRRVAATFRIAPRPRS